MSGLDPDNAAWAAEYEANEDNDDPMLSWDRPRWLLDGKYARRKSTYFSSDAPETDNVRIIVRSLDLRGIRNEVEVSVRGRTQTGRIDLVVELDPLLVGLEVKRYSIHAPRLIADAIAQGADYARAEIVSGLWRGRSIDFVFVGPVPNLAVKYYYVPAEILSRYTAALGVGLFDQQMFFHAFGQEAIRFVPDGFKFVCNFDRVKKHAREFRR